MPKLTVGDIAKHIQRRGEPISAAIDRFRTWTKMGIIKPTGEYNPGRGRKKQYTSRALLEAVFLQALCDAMGAPATVLGDLVRQLSRLVRAGTLLFFPRDLRRGSTFIVVNRNPGGGLEIYIVNQKDLGAFTAKSRADIHIVINFERLFDRLPYEFTDIVPTEREISLAQQTKKRG